MLSGDSVVGDFVFNLSLQGPVCGTWEIRLQFLPVAGRIVCLYKQYTQGRCPAGHAFGLV